MRYSSPVARLSCVLLAVAAFVLPAAAQSNSTDCTYATREHISEVFNHLTKSDYPDFFKSVADDVDWNVMGTHPLAGQYHNKTIFAINAIARLGKIQDTSIKGNTTIVNIIGGCNEAWSTQEIRAQLTMKNGLKFDNRYAWVTRWNEEGIIVQTRAYLDSALVAKAIYENEAPTNSNVSTPRLVPEPGPGGIPDLTPILG